jgi:RNase P/RNase MRP subunit p29
MGVVTGDTVTINYSVYSASFATKTVGNAKPVTVSGVTLSGGDAGNYTVSQPSGLTADITAKNLTINGAVANNKQYDGNTTATVDFTSASLVTVVSGDSVSINSSGYSASFATKTVGNAKPVTVSGVTLSGGDAGNYTVSQPSGLAADITVLHITGTFTADNKVYNGNNSATVLTRSLVGAISGDAVSLSGGTATFSDKNVGMGKTVTLTGATLSGADTGNYVLDSVSTTTANITAKNLTISGAVAQNKVYNGLTGATVDFTLATLAVVESGDSVTINSSTYTANFNNKNVGTAKPVTVSGVTLSGGDAGNYTVSQPSGLTANITVLHITGSFTASTKVYDGTTAATVLTGSLSGTISGDIVSLTGGAATFNNKNVGTGKTVTLTGATLTGADAGNYFLDSVSTTTADITVLHITGTFTAQNKQYDGTIAAAVLTRSLVGAVSGDAVTLIGGTATFSDKNVGTGKTVTLIGASLTGGDSGNYVLDSVATTTANITPATLTIKATNQSKVFGATYTPVTTNPSPDFTIIGTIYTGDSVTSITLTCAGYAASATVAGSPYTITASAAMGTGLGNYSIGYQTGTFTVNAWTITGFYQPVDMPPVVNTVKGGSTVPLKFNIYAGNVERTSVSDVQGGTCQLFQTNCSGGPEDPIGDLPNTGGTALRYDTTGHQFIQNWQTPKGANQCYVVRMTAIDGSYIEAYFKTK